MGPASTRTVLEYPTRRCCGRGWREEDGVVWCVVYCSLLYVGYCLCWCAADDDQIMMDACVHHCVQYGPSP
eukprot:scaffold29225_cov40-Attheya_sp.AAC.4